MLSFKALELCLIVALYSRVMWVVVVNHFKQVKQASIEEELDYEIEMRAAKKRESCKLFLESAGERPFILWKDKVFILRMCDGLVKSSPNIKPIESLYTHRRYTCRTCTPHISTILKIKPGGSPVLRTSGCLLV
jgi:hypothetical protein